MADELKEAENAELLTLHRIDETSTRLQTQGKYLEALECMERGLVLRQHFFGPTSDEVWDACKTVGEMCNLLAMTYLQQENFSMVLELLKKAEILTERDDKGRAVTYNNLACYYRRQGKLHAALTYLQKTLRLEQALENVENRADTHLNLCAVLSQLGRHGGALDHAQSALILLQEELFPNPMNPGEKKTAGADRIAVLAIAYHNIGVEQEFLKRSDMAIDSYRKGVEISESYLGKSHGITQTLNNSFLAAQSALAVRKKKQEHKVRSRKIGSRKHQSNRSAWRSSPGKNPPISEKEEEKWRNIEHAYGEVVNTVKTKAYGGRGFSTGAGSSSHIGLAPKPNDQPLGQGDLSEPKDTSAGNSDTMGVQDLITPRRQRDTERDESKSEKDDNGSDSGETSNTETSGADEKTELGHQTSKKDVSIEKNKLPASGDGILEEESEVDPNRADSEEGRESKTMNGDPRAEETKIPGEKLCPESRQSQKIDDVEQKQEAE